MSARRLLTDLGACRDAVAWVRDRDVATAWEECPSGEWQLWVAETVGVDRRRLTLAACACARTVLHLATPGDDRPRVAIETAEAWARGEATVTSMATAIDAAMDAAVAAADDAARVASRAASLAATRDAARDATRAAAVAAAVAAAGGAAGGAAGVAEWDAAHAEHARLVREIISLDDVLRALDARGAP